MILVLRKVGQLNIKYRKNGGPIIDVCTGARPDEFTALRQRSYTREKGKCSKTKTTIKCAYSINNNS